MKGDKRGECVLAWIQHLILHQWVKGTLWDLYIVSKLNMHNSSTGRNVYSFLISGYQEKSDNSLSRFPCYLCIHRYRYLFAQNWNCSEDEASGESWRMDEVVAGDESVSGILPVNLTLRQSWSQRSWSGWSYLLPLSAPRRSRKYTIGYFKLELVNWSIQYHTRYTM